MRHRPLLVWTAAFAAGIGLGALYRLPPLLLVLVFAVGAGLLLGGGRVPALLVLSLLPLGLCAGAVRLAAFQRVTPTDISYLADSPAPVTLLGTVQSDPEPRRGGRETFYFRAEMAHQRGRDAAMTGDVYVMLGPEAVKTCRPEGGDRLRLTGTLQTPEAATNPGAFSWHDYLARRAVYAEMRVTRPGAAQKLDGGGGGPFLRVAWHVKAYVVAALDRALPGPPGAVLGGILIGRRSELAPDLMADFVRTGTVHILASAGLHVGILAFWLERLLRRLALPRWGRALVLMAVLVLYALVCGGRPAVVRAVVVAAVWFGGVLWERTADPPTSVAAAALLILMLQPTALLEAGFQMSFLTVLTLAVAMPVWDGFWRPRVQARIPSPRLARATLWAVEGIGLSLLAQVGSLPVVAASYNEFSLSGWLANCLVVPLLFILIPLGWLGIGAACLWHAGGAVILSAAGWGIALIVRIVRAFGEASWASLAVPTPPPALMLAFYAAVFAACARLGERLPPAPLLTEEFPCPTTTQVPLTHPDDDC